MRIKTLAVTLASAFAIAPALAQWDGPYQRSRNDPVEYARVVESQPVYASGQEECWNPRTRGYELRREAHHGLGAGTAAGAVAGGVIGNQVEHGEGAVAGAILGGIIGHQIERRERNDDALDLGDCRVVNSDDSAPVGYDVRYRYRGQEYMARMASAPGTRLQVGQDVNWDGTPFG
jgi:uncharacterized protein YcfJ